jgi:hypothetical protein
VALQDAHWTGERPGPPVRDLTELGDDLVAAPVQVGEPILKRALGTWQFGRQRAPQLGDCRAAFSELAGSSTVASPLKWIVSSLMKSSIWRYTSGEK